MHGLPGETLRIPRPCRPHSGGGFPPYFVSEKRSPTRRQKNNTGHNTGVFQQRRVSGVDWRQVGGFQGLATCSRSALNVSSVKPLTKCFVLGFFLLLIMYRLRILPLNRALLTTNSSGPIRQTPSAVFPCTASGVIVSTPPTQTQWNACLPWLRTVKRNNCKNCKVSNAKHVRFMVSWMING